MLKCRDVAHQASDYLDHNLSLWQRLGILFHLLICHHCRRFIRQLKLVSRFIKIRPKPEANKEAVEEVMDRIKQPNNT